MSVDKRVDSTQLDNNLTSIANAIRTKTGSSGQLSFPSGFVNAIQAGVDYFDENADFCFWDYDGTPLYSFTDAQIQAMTQLPTPPSHSNDDIPLTFLYWNWTLADLKVLHAPMDVGAIYKPTDGKFHWFYKLNNKTGLTCSFTTSYTTDVTINWGDGTGDEHWGTSTTNGANPTHTYSSPGLYHCTWSGTGRPSSNMRTEGNECLVGKFVIGNGMCQDWLSYYWKGAIAGSRIETIVTNDNNNGNMTNPIPHQCYDLKAWIEPPKLQKWATNAYLRDCYSLKCLCLSNGSNNFLDYFCTTAQIKRVRFSPNTTWNRFSFSGCRNLQFFDGPRIAYKDLENATGLRRLVIKNTIDSNALGSAVKLEQIWCGLTTPPTLSATTPLSGIVSWGKIHVPASALSDYQNATNWSTYADYMVGDWVANPVK